MTHILSASGMTMWSVAAPFKDNISFLLLANAVYCIVMLFYYSKRGLVVPTTYIYGDSSDVAFKFRSRRVTTMLQTGYIRVIYIFLIK